MRQQRIWKEMLSPREKIEDMIGQKIGLVPASLLDVNYNSTLP